MVNSQPLYELFAPNLIATSVVKKFKLGDSFTLISKVGLILEGVVGVDILSDSFDKPITARLAKKQDVLNAEEALEATQFYTQSFVCETPVCLLAILDVNYFRTQLNSKSQAVQNIVVQSLLSAIYHNHNELIQSLLGVGQVTARDRVLWAIKRYRQITRCPSYMPIMKGRIAIHTGLRRETVSKVLANLEEDGVISMTHRTITLIENEEAA